MKHAFFFFFFVVAFFCGATRIPRRRPTNVLTAVLPTSLRRRPAAVCCVSMTSSLEHAWFVSCVAAL